MNDITRKVLDSMYCDGKVQVAELVNSLPDDEKEKLIAPLISILRSDSNNDRVNAIYMLGLLGPMASPAVPALIQAPEDATLANVAWEVSKTLPNIGASFVVPALIKALGQAPPEGSRSWESKNHDARIMEHLAAFGPAASSAAPYLAPYLGTYTSEKALGSIGPAAIPAVIEEVCRGVKRHPWVYVNAAGVLALVGAAAIQPLREAFDQATTPEARLSILQIFRYKPKLPPEIYAVLIEKCFTDPHRNVSREAHAIINAQGPAMIPALRAGMANANLCIRAKSAAAILKCLPDESTAIKTLVSLLADEKGRLHALRAVTEVGNTCETFVPAVMKSLQDPSSEVRREATECLKAMGQTTRIINDLKNSLSVVETKPTLQADVSEVVELDHLSMPSDTFIKETLEQQFTEEVKFYSAHRLDQTKFLSKHILIEVKGNAFGRKMRGEASGLYAYDGKQLKYLDGQNGKGYISEILRAELAPIDRIDPVELALFFTGTLLGGFVFEAHRVVEPSLGTSPSFGLELLTKPSVRALESGGWRVNFWTLCEWGACMGGHRSLHEHAIVVSEQFDVTYEERLNLECWFQYSMPNARLEVTK